MSLLIDGLPGPASYPKHGPILSAEGLAPLSNGQHGHRHNKSAGHIMQIMVEAKIVILRAVFRALKKDVIGGHRSVSG